MNFRNHKNLTAAALLAIFAVTQVYIGVGFANPNAVVTPPAALQQLMGILTTRDNQSILVNGVSTVSGATIPSGATIETPDNVGATINIGALGSLCIAPNTKLTVVFNKSGNGGDINTNLTEGCVILTTNKNVKGTIVAPQANAQINPSIGGTIDVCLQPGQAAKVNEAAASKAGAGASGAGCNPPAGAGGVSPGGLFGLGRTATAAIFDGLGGGGGCSVFCNPSPSNP